MKNLKPITGALILQYRLHTLLILYILYFTWVSLKVITSFFFFNEFLTNGILLNIHIMHFYYNERDKNIYCDPIRFYNDLIYIYIYIYLAVSVEFTRQYLQNVNYAFFKFRIERFTNFHAIIFTAFTSKNRLLFMLNIKRQIYLQ